MATTKTQTKKTTTSKPKPKKKSLGKGLDVIFGEGIENAIEEISKITNVSTSKAEEIINEVTNIKLSEIHTNPYQPRRVFDQEKLNELAISIQENGLLSPIVLKKNKAGTYYIIAGERRFRASKIAKLEVIKAIVVDVSERKMQELALIENIQREDLNPIEVSVAIKDLIEKHKVTHEAASKILGKSRTYITNSLRLLTLDNKIINAVLEEKITFGHAKPLITVTDEIALNIFNRIQEQELNVREVENIVRGYKLQEARKNSPKKEVPKKSPQIEYAEDLIRNKVRSRVEIINKKIIIRFKDNKQLNRILERIDALEK